MQEQRFRPFILPSPSVQKREPDTQENKKTLRLVEDYIVNLYKHLGEVGKDHSEFLPDNFMDILAKKFWNFKYLDPDTLFQQRNLSFSQPVRTNIIKYLNQSVKPVLKQLDNKPKKTFLKRVNIWRDEDRPFRKRAFHQSKQEIKRNFRDFLRVLVTEKMMTKNQQQQILGQKKGQQLRVKRIEPVRQQQLFIL